MENDVFSILREVFFALVCLYGAVRYRKRLVMCLAFTIIGLSFIVPVVGLGDFNDVSTLIGIAVVALATGNWKDGDNG